MLARASIHRALLAAVALAVVGVSGCVSNMECRDSVDPMEGRRCVQQGSPAEAVGTAAAAGIAWGTVGCRVNGCNPGYTCNDDSGFCEPARCSEGHGCPPAYQCNYEEGHCE